MWDVTPNTLKLPDSYTFLIALADSIDNCLQGRMIRICRWGSYYRSSNKFGETHLLQIIRRHGNCSSKFLKQETTGLTSFPDYLVLHMRTFFMEEGWVLKKLDVYIDVPDVIDISHMRSKGLHPGEELLPEEVESSPSADDNIVSHLIAMGLNNIHCKKAAINTSNAGVEEAMNWLLSHMDDPDIDDPISESVPLTVDQSQVDTLVSFGFQEDIAINALKASGGNIEKSTDYIFSNPNASAPSDMDATSSGAECSADGGLPDGGG
ncbi:hypothetical protein MKX03_026285, partial [Papaver bracteatum]